MKFRFLAPFICWTSRQLELKVISCQDLLHSNTVILPCPSITRTTVVFVSLRGIGIALYNLASYKHNVSVKNGLFNMSRNLKLILETSLRFPGKFLLDLFGNLLMFSSNFSGNFRIIATVWMLVGNISESLELFGNLRDSGEIIRVRRPFFFPTVDRQLLSGLLQKKSNFEVYLAWQAWFPFSTCHADCYSVI